MKDRFKDIMISMYDPKNFQKHDEWQVSENVVHFSWVPAESADFGGRSAKCSAWASCGGRIWLMLGWTPLRLAKNRQDISSWWHGKLNCGQIQRSIRDILTALVQRYLKSDSTNFSIVPSHILSSPCTNSSVTRLKLCVNWLNSMWLEIHRKLVFLRVMSTPPKQHTFSIAGHQHINWTWYSVFTSAEVLRLAWKKPPKAQGGSDAVSFPCIYPGVRRILLSMEAWGKIFAVE